MPGSLVAELRQAVSARGIAATVPYVVCRRDPQGQGDWLLDSAGGYAIAEKMANERSGHGKFDVFVLPTDERHGIMKLIGNKLVSVTGD